MNAPIIIFAYNRPIHLSNTLNSLKNCTNIERCQIFVYCDGPKKESDVLGVSETKVVAHDFKDANRDLKIEIITSEVNKGLARSVIDAVTYKLTQFDAVIVLEDDLVVSKSFIDYMNNALEYYKNDMRIWSISGYNSLLKFPKDYSEQVYLSRRASSWGWATWRDRWELVDWEIKDYSSFEYNLLDRRKFNRGGKDMSAMLDAQIDRRIDSWAIRWCYSQYRHDMYSVYPIYSLVNNIGLDGTGTHKVKSSDISNFKQEVLIYLSDIQFDERIQKEFNQNYKMNNKVPLLSFIRHLLAKSKL